MLKIGSYEFSSRLLLGTGKYPNFDVQKQSCGGGGGGGGGFRRRKY